MKISTVAQKPLGWQTVLGAGAWTVLALAAATGMIRLGVIEILFLLAPWIVVPVAVHLVPVVADSGLAANAWRVLDWLVLPAAASATASSFLPVGKPAALLASAWLLVCLLLAGEGLLRFLRYRAASFAQFCFAVGEVYLLVGASWLVISRLGCGQSVSKSPSCC